MKTYTWDELYERAEDKPCMSPELKAKDEARYEVRNLILDLNGPDLENTEIPEEQIDDYCKSFDIRFNGNGSIVSRRKEVIYAHDEAARIVELFEDVLVNNGVKIPSDDDSQRGEDNDAALYGNVYSDLLDEVEGMICRLFSKKEEAGVIPDVFGGTF